MQIGVVGLNHKMANLTLRDHVARICERRFRAGFSLHVGQSFVLLSTCNRTEVYFCSDDLSASQSYILQVMRGDIAHNEEEFDQKLYTYFGHDCFLHLARVTAGLDSALLAETEIQGQVKGAYNLASDASSLPYELHYLFQKGLRIGKQVRAAVPFERGMASIEHAVAHAGASHFSDQEKTRILLVGASQINRQMLSFLKQKGWKNISLCNRSPLKDSLGVSLLPWEDFNQWSTFDWVIFGTKANHFLVEKAQKNGKRQLLIDLSVPRNVAPSLARAPDTSLLNIDQLNRTLQICRKNREKFLNQADKLVTDATRGHVTRFLKKQNHELRISA